MITKRIKLTYSKVMDIEDDKGNINKHMLYFYKIPIYENGKKLFKVKDYNLDHENELQSREFDIEDKYTFILIRDEILTVYYK